MNAHYKAAAGLGVSTEPIKTSTNNQWFPETGCPATLPRFKDQVCGLWAKAVFHRSLAILTLALSILLPIVPHGQTGPWVLLPPMLSDTGVSLRWNSEPSTLSGRIEFTDDLLSGAWQPCRPLSQWPIGWNTWTGTKPSEVAQRFYRLVAQPITPVVRGHLVSNVLRQTYSASELALAFLLMGVSVAPESGVEAYQIVYDTITARGLPAQATGAILVPVTRSKPLPLLSYQHGTVLKRDQVPSMENNVERLLGLGMAGTGYLVVIPDYLGLGLSQGMHPYIHAGSEASAVVDMIRAARSFCAERSINLNSQLFLTGYSQGGHATLAAQREMELHLPDEFPITASAPMAGPYDLSGTMLPLFVSDKAYGSPCYLPYVVFSYHEAYGMYDDPGEIFKAPYDTTLPPLFDGLHNEGQVNAIMPSVPSQVLQTSFREMVLADPNHPFRQALRQNDLWDWTPHSQTRLFHCHGDTTVPYANAEVALREFRARGASQVELIDPYPSGDHGTGAAFCLLAGKAWFDSLKQ